MMSKSSLGRLGLFLVSLLGLMSLFSASAFAAEAPTSIVYEATEGITHVEIVGITNPNGASTTVNLEYRDASAGGEYVTLLSKSIGSGTTPVTVRGMLNGLKPQNYYQLRVGATNSFGTTYSAVEDYEARWKVEGKPQGYTTEATSSGTWKLEYKPGGIPVKLECNENGFGTIGHEKGAGDTHQMNLSGCVYYQNGKVICKPASFTFNLDASFKAENLSKTICPGEEAKTAFSFPAAFLVDMPFFEFNELTQPLTMTASAKLNSNSVTVTVTSNWKLTGADAGLKFGAAEFK
jgi:hypothetical protein